jgi:hypothetical protein
MDRARRRRRSWSTGCEKRQGFALRIRCNVRNLPGQFMVGGDEWRQCTMVGWQPQPSAVVGARFTNWTALGTGKMGAAEFVDVQHDVVSSRGAP